MIIELHTLSASHEKDVLALMYELDPEIEVTSAFLRRTVESEASHFFAAVDDSGRIMGCATLCVYDSPTGQKASVEDVMVGSRYRGQGLGKLLMEHVISFARSELRDVDVHLTSQPHRVAANELYKKMGFEKRETNAYVMKVRES